jgi:basic membrane protein A
MQKSHASKLARWGAVAGIAAASLVLAVLSPSANAANLKKVTVGIAYDLGGRNAPGFNQLAYIGYKDYLKMYPGAKLKELQGNTSDTDATRSTRIKLLVQAGCNPVVVVGFTYGTALKQIAAAYPKVKFGIVDDGSVVAPNVEWLLFHAQESSYLAGVAAASTSKTDNVGFIGGVKIPLIQAFEAGFTAGVKKVKPNATVQVTYITNPPDFGGFNAPDKGHEAALGMFQNGADVVYSAAGATGGGAHKAAFEQHKWSIGVDADEALYASNAQYKTAILTSALKNVNVGVNSFLSDVHNNKFKAGDHEFTLANGGVGLAYTGNYLSAATIATIKSLTKQVGAGTIVVPTIP